MIKNEFRFFTYLFVLLTIFSYSSVAAKGELVPIVDLILSPSDDTETGLDALPNDTGGVHTAVLFDSNNADSADYSYYVYTPSGYVDDSLSYPALIFLHGKGERGNGTSSISQLSKVLRHGPPKLINADLGKPLADRVWRPSYPVLVFSPQYHGTTGNANNWGAGDPNRLKTYIEYVLQNYRVDPSRIYLTGLSHGGNGVYDYLTRLSDSQSLIAAAAPIAAFGTPNGVNKSANTPVWAFVGSEDNTNERQTIRFFDAYNSQTPPPRVPARLTIFDGGRHDVWTRIYNGVGSDDGETFETYSPFDMNLMDWFFQYQRDTS